MGDMAYDALDRGMRELVLFDEHRYSPMDEQLEFGIIDRQGNVYEPDQQDIYSTSLYSAKRY